MAMQTREIIGVPGEVIEAIQAFPVHREVEHCGQKFLVPGLDIYAACPHCGIQIKLRCFSAVTEIEDVFDAIISWMSQPGATDVVEKRRAQLQEE